MAQRYDAKRAQEIVSRWCVIAEQRLDHLTELYESGRWRRYHSETAFMENIREAKTAVETWRGLARHEATPDNIAVDWSWLDRPAPPAEQAPPMRYEIQQSQAGILGTEAVQAALMSIMPSEHESIVIAEAADDAASGEGIVPESDFADAMLPDNRTVQERYPVLRNAL